MELPSSVTAALTPGDVRVEAGAWSPQQSQGWALCDPGAHLKLPKSLKPQQGPPSLWTCQWASQSSQDEAEQSRSG